MKTKRTDPFYTPKQDIPGAQAGAEPVPNFERLPQSAQKIFETEADAAREERLRSLAFQEKDNELTMAIADAGAVLRSRQDHPNSKQADIDKAAADLAKAKAKRAEHQAVRPTTGSVHSFLETFVQENRGPWRVVSVTPTTIDGNGPGEMVQYVREQIAATRAAIKTTENAPLGSETVAAGIAAQVHAIAEKPNVFAVRKMKRDGPRESQGEIKFPSRRQFNGSGFVDEIDSAATFFWLFENEIVERLMAEALKGFDDSKAMTAAERSDKLAELSATFLQLEHEAEFWFQAGRRMGIKCDRLTANPLAILQIERA